MSSTSRLASLGRCEQSDITRANATVAVLLKTNRYEWMTNPNSFLPLHRRAGSTANDAINLDSRQTTPTAIGSPACPIPNSGHQTLSTTGGTPHTPRGKPRTKNKGKGIASSVDTQQSDHACAPTSSTSTIYNTPKASRKKSQRATSDSKYVCPPADDPRWNIWTIGHIPTNESRKSLGITLSILRKVLKDSDVFVGQNPSGRMRLNAEQLVPLISARRAELQRPTLWNPEWTWDKWMLRDGGTADMGFVQPVHTKERIGKRKRDDNGGDIRAKQAKTSKQASPAWRKISCERIPSSPNVPTTKDSCNNGRKRGCESEDSEATPVQKRLRHDSLASLFRDDDEDSCWEANLYMELDAFLRQEERLEEQTEMDRVQVEESPSVERRSDKEKFGEVAQEEMSEEEDSEDEASEEEMSEEE
ncbi:hypothetical protein K440DRAFT_641446 [Wilcoxina mikolae CBS 423.85]|nr:hypothetical protein K440DRAFT_641446 [Wilcoxina mikolae CBS 423.85]